MKQFRNLIVYNRLVAPKFRDQAFHCAPPSLFIAGALIEHSLYDTACAIVGLYLPLTKELFDEKFLEETMLARVYRD